MPKIKPTSILPYTKSVVPAIHAVKVGDIENALSARTPEKAPLVKDLFRVLYAFESNYKHLTKPSPPQFTAPSSIVPTIVRAWRRRKIN